MSLERIHLCATYVLLCMGTTGLWMGEGEAARFPYPILVAACALTAYVVTDRLRWIQLPIVISNTLAVLIFGLIVYEVARDPSATVLALAHFLVYLQVAKFFRYKHDADFWQLYGLNVLQLAIACVVNRDVTFGMLLAAYTALATMTLGLFQVRRHEDLVVQSGGTRDGFRWMFVKQWMSLLALSLPLALFAFWATPRIGGARTVAGVSSTQAAKQLTTGFSPNMRLDEMQQILENKDVVFNVWPTGPDGRPVELPPDLLWRGQVFVTYKNKEWTGLKDLRDFNKTWDRVQPVGESQLLLRVEQTIPTGDVLFAPKPLFWARAARETEDVEFLSTEGRLRFRRIVPRENKTPHEAVLFSMIVGRSGYRDVDQKPPASAYLALAAASPHLERLAGLARNLTADVPQGDVQEKIRRLLEYLTAAGGFRYTLDIHGKDDSSDPIEDFLFNRKEGHCEYFASALALMLRVVGVPTRVVNGFKGADYNAAGGYYQVRQLLAHSWVEAYLPAEGRWMTLDPTPGDGRNQVVQEQRSSLQWLSELFDALANAWASYVVGYSDSEQKRLIYLFLQESWNAALEWFRAFAAWLAAAAQLRLAPRFWLSKQGLYSAAGLMLLLAAASATRRRSPRWRGWSWLRRINGRRAEANVWPLYEQWLAALAARGWMRPPTKTPREFARRLSGAWVQEPRLAPWADLPERMAEIFYAARFGARPPDEEEAALLTQRISSFALANK